MSVSTGASAKSGIDSPTTDVTTMSAELKDSVKKIEFKNLIKDKVLKPSKLARFDNVRGHHSHLVIRDSHYLLKAPTSFITCASCHRGRVLKISMIQELTTEQILDEIYHTILKNPCSKRKNTSKENQVISDAYKKQQLGAITPAFGAHDKYKRSHPLGSLQQLPTYLPQTPMVLLPQTNGYPLPPASSIHESIVPNTSQNTTSDQVPTFDAFFSDFEPLTNFPQLSKTMEIASTGSAVKVTSFTLTSLFNAQSNFPANLDMFLSQAMSQQFGTQFFTEDTLFVPLPTYACTLFAKDSNKLHFRRDEVFQRVLNARIHDFVHQPNVNLSNLRIIIMFNAFQEGVPDRPQENQSHKYVGNVYVLHSFSVLADSSLSFSNLRYSFNHNYTWIDSKHEAAKNELFNELILSKLQNEVFMKTNEVALGTHVNPLVLDRAALMTVIPFTTEDTFVLSASGSLFVVCFICLKLLRILTGEDGLQMIGYVSTVHFNSKFHLYLLRLMLENLKQGSDAGKHEYVRAPEF